jgi:hypothetical protein
MPQKQTRILTEDDVLVSQARKQKGGVVVYTGMNDVGEFYSGAKKLSSSTGEEKIVEAPILSYTGDDAEGTNTNKLDATFDNILARGRITVEGGDGAKETSQFYGPVSFNKKVVSTSDEGVNVKNLYVKGDTTTYKLVTVGISTPTDANLVNRGNISLKSLPNEGYIGQVYVDGEWKKFGPISQSKDILDFKVDKIGIGNSNDFANTSDPGVNDVAFYVGGKSKFKDVVFSGQVEIESGITLNNVNFNNINIRKTAFFSGAGAGGTSYAIYVYNPGDLVDSQTVPRLRSRFYDLEVAGVSTFSGLVGIGTTIFTGTSNQLLQINSGAYISGSVGIGTTNPTDKLSIIGDVGIQTSLNLYSSNQVKKGTIQAVETTEKYQSGLVINVPNGNEIAFSDGDSRNVVITGDGNLGIGTTTLSSKLQVHGTIGISSIGDSEDLVPGGRTQFSSSSTSGFILNHNHSTDIVFQNQGIERFRVGSGITATYTSLSAGSDLTGSHFKLKNDGLGDVVLSWFTDNLNNRRWYAGIDVSDSYSWKLASTNSSVSPGQESFDSVGENTARNQIETKLKVNQNGDLNVLGELTLSGLNTPSRFEVGSVGVSTIRGNLNLFNLVNTSGQTVTVSDFNINTDKFTVAGNTGNVTTKGTIVSDGILTVNSQGNSSFNGTLGVTGNVTSSGFAVNGSPSTSGIPNILRADGTNSKLESQDVINALGFTPQPPIATSNLPVGNSEVLKDISGLFNGTGTSFQLFRTSINPQTATNAVFIPLGPDNLIVSLGGVIQKPSTDYTIRQENGAYTNIIDFVEAPPNETPCFILALGGQGSLKSNQDWNNKGEILVATGDNAATTLAVGANGTILTADSSKSGGVEWKNSLDLNGSITGTSLSAGSGSINGGSITGTSLSVGTGSVTAGSFVGNGTIPVGGIIMWSGSTIPTGWALCNGLSGTPDLRDRFIVGSGSGYAIGATGGSANAVLVSHSHTGSTNETGNHQHFVAGSGGGQKLSNRQNLLNWVLGWSGFVGGDSRQDYVASSSEGTANAGGSSSAGAHQHTVTTLPEGVSGTNQNLPPYYALAFIMRTA